MGLVVICLGVVAFALGDWLWTLAWVLFCTAIYLIYKVGYEHGYRKASGQADTLARIGFEREHRRQFQAALRGDQ